METPFFLVYRRDHQLTSIPASSASSLLQEQVVREVGSETGGLDIELSILHVQWTLPSYKKSGYWKNKIMQHQRCSTEATS